MTPQLSRMVLVGVAGAGLVACARPMPAPPGPSAASAPSGRAVELAATHSIARTEVTFTVEGRTIPGTLVAPTTPGPWPAVVLLAGSGPTDRDWASPLLPGTAGSGALLAEELARHGAVVLRFDKAGTGGNPGPTGQAWTLDTYRAEAREAVALVRARPEVRADRVFVAGHSEGGLHATRLAQLPGSELAGILYLSSAARSMAATILTQLEHQLTNPLAGLTPEQALAELTALRAAFADFLAGRPIDPAHVSTLPPLRQLVAGIAAPATAELMRGLLAFDTAAEAATVALPALVLGGGKDIQVDPELDVRHLADALRAAGREVTLHIAPDADHVLKHEPKSIAELRANLAAVQAGYNADARTLDPDAVRAIVAWLAAQTR